MAIENERKRRLGFASSLKSNNTDTTKKSKISYQFVEDQRAEKSTFSDVKHFRRNSRRWSSSKLPLTPLTYTETCKNLQNLPVHRLLLGCSRHRVKNVKSPLRRSSGNFFKQVKKKGLKGFGTSANLSQSCAKTSPQKPCCRCNDEEEDGASTQRPCSYDGLVGADRECK